MDSMDFIEKDCGLFPWISLIKIADYGFHGFLKINHDCHMFPRDPRFRLQPNFFALDSGFLPWKSVWRSVTAATPARALRTNLEAGGRFGPT
jgi:hypothetical protein